MGIYTLVLRGKVEVSRSVINGLLFKALEIIMMVLSLFNATLPETLEAASLGVYPEHSRHWSIREMLYLAFDAGFSDYEACIIVSIALAESGGDDGALGYNPPDTYCPLGSMDRGILQINSCYHSEVSDNCAFDARCSFREAYRISYNGIYYDPWTTYQLQLHLAFYPQVERVLAEIRGEEWETDP